MLAHSALTVDILLLSAHNVNAILVLTGETIDPPDEHLCLCVADDEHYTTSDYNAVCSEPLNAEPHDVITRHMNRANASQTRNN